MIPPTSNDQVSVVAAGGGHLTEVRKCVGAETGPRTSRSSRSLAVELSEPLVSELRDRPTTRTHSRTASWRNSNDSSVTFGKTDILSDQAKLRQQMSTEAGNFTDLPIENDVVHSIAMTA